MRTTGENITAMSKLIDGSYPPEVLAVPELHQRRRIDKIAEEYGEAIQAFGGVYGENPRKGVTHTIADVLTELLDAASAALGAYESLTGNQGIAMPALAAHCTMRQARLELAVRDVGR